LAIDCHDNIAGSACFFFNKHFDWRERDACNECRLPVTEKHQYMYKCGNKFCKKKKIKNIEGMLIVLSLHKTELVM
jgi:hypothetical protein